MSVPTQEDSTDHLQRGADAGPNRASQLLTDTETRILRQLVQFIQKGINNEELKIDKEDDDDIATATSGHAIGKKDISDDNEQKRLREKLANFKPRNFITLKEIPQRHDPIRQHVQSLLNALGGGHRTARSLEAMQQGLHALCRGDSISTNGLYPSGCLKSLRSLQKVIDELSEAFNEFGVFNTEFFATLQDIKKASEGIMFRIDAEYEAGRTKYYTSTNEYIDLLFGPFVVNLERYLQILTGIAEKEIPAIRQSQDFVSQQHVNLTTIATFLSSVTATTLQISAGAPASLLTTVTNAFWFVSLVFSAASAVYSLLEMTWRRSPIRRPDKSLPKLAHTCLRNGPMFALIISLLTFSIGLCLLAFLVADQQGGVAPAAVPTSFAGAHAQAILFLSVWYLFEYWKTRHPKSWGHIQHSPPLRYGAHLHVVLLAIPRRTKNVVHRVTEYATRMRERFRILAEMLLGPFRMAGELAGGAGTSRNSDPELGNPPSPRQVDVRLDNHEHSEKNRGGDVQSEGDHPAAPKLISDPERVPTTEDLPGHPTSEKYIGRPDDLLQFSPDYKRLASAFANTVTIYNAERSFEISNTIVVRDAGPIRQILWNPGAEFRQRSKHKEILVRSSSHVYAYNLVQPDNIRAQKLLRLKNAIGSIRWLREGDNGFDGISCLLGAKLKLFAPPTFDTSDTPSDDSLTHENGGCKELASCNLSGPDVKHVLDATFYRENKVVCLVKLKDQDQSVALLVVNRGTMSIEKIHYLYDPDDLLNRPLNETLLTVTVSHKQGKCLIHRKGVTYVVDLSSASVFDKLYLPPNCDFSCEDDRLICGIGGRDVRVYHTATLSHLHRITTRSSGAIVGDVESSTLRHDPRSSYPYLFAFRYGDGSVKIWSIQSNYALDQCKSARLFEVRDTLLGFSSEPVITTGRFLILPAPRAQEAPESKSGRANDQIE